MYGGIGVSVAVISGCIRFLAKKGELRLRWGLFGAFVFFWVFVVGGALNSSQNEITAGRTSKPTGLVLIVKSLLGLTDRATPLHIRGLDRPAGYVWLSGLRGQWALGRQSRRARAVD